jgi:hypothetical protein
MGSEIESAIPLAGSAPTLTDNSTETQPEKPRTDVETASVDEAPKGHYSKVSVWTMVLFSGLAIGSDG